MTTNPLPPLEGKRHLLEVVAAARGLCSLRSAGMAMAMMALPPVPDAPSRPGSKLRDHDGLPAAVTDPVPPGRALRLGMMSINLNAPQAHLSSAP